MGLLGSLNSMFGFGDPIKGQNEDPNIENNTNMLRQMMMNWGKPGSSRPYDIERNRMTNDSFNQAQQMGQAMMRSMNRRGVLNSGMTGANTNAIWNQAQSDLSRNLAGLEGRKIQDAQQRKLQSMDLLRALLGMDINRDQFGRNMGMQQQLGNLQAQGMFSGALGGLGSALGGLDWGSMFGGKKIEIL